MIRFYLSIVLYIYNIYVYYNIYIYTNMKLYHNYIALVPPPRICLANITYVTSAR